LPSPQARTLTVKLDGNVLQSTPDVAFPSLARRLNVAQASLSDYRAWFCMHAVHRAQLFEILSQFWENHFVTQTVQELGLSEQPGLRRNDRGHSGD